MIIVTEGSGTVKGTMHWRPVRGERLTLTGKWGTYQGKREFSFTVATPNIPGDPRSALHYAVSRTIGIGPKLEQAIWDARGEAWMDVQCSDVKLLTEDRLARLQETILELNGEYEKSNTISWLMGKGATIAMAVAAWEKWQSAAIGVISSDCYQLTTLKGYGFCHVDRGIRLAFDIADDDPRRIASGVLYAMTQETASGSTVVRWDALRDRAIKELGGHLSLIVQSVRDMFTTGALVPFPSSALIATEEDFSNAMSIWDYCKGERNGD